MLSVLFSLTFPAAAFFIVYVLLLLGGTEDEDAAAGGWRALSGGKRFCYLASALLPPPCAPGFPYFGTAFLGGSGSSTAWGASVTAVAALP